MRTLFQVPVAAILFSLSPPPCQALNVSMDVSEKQAREWKVDIKSRTIDDTRVWVSLTLETKGVWQQLRQVELAVKSDGKHLATAPLAVSNPTPDSICIGFSVHPTVLKESKLHLCVDSKGSMIYRFKLSDFVDEEKTSGDSEKPKPKSEEHPR